MFVWSLTYRWVVSDRLSSNKRSEDPSSLYFYFLLVTDSMSIVKANMKKLPSSSSLLWFFFTRGFFADMIFRRGKMIRESNASQRDKLLFALSISHVIQYELSKEILKILAIQIIEKSLGFIISDNSIIFRQDFVHIMDLIIGNKYTLLDDWLLIQSSLFVDDHRRPGAGPPNCFPTLRTFPYFSLFDMDLRIRHLLTD